MSGSGAAAPAINVPEYSVSEISGAVKRTVEEAFGYVRVRGEISRPSFPGSGHVYLRLKDDNAVLDAVIWRGTVRKLQTRPEEGLEVICTGRLTTYPGKSSYQLVIEAMEPAGEGALLKMLEERRKRLAAEGLFASEAKQPLPFLPRVIGVITSPTGAVIRDILHRLADRFPRHVLVWPVRVQGDGAAEAVTAAIEGFNRMAADGPIPRPDLLIVARGGGSLEDLWAFNEEIVVRAVAASGIPLISAIGHETDTTLIDFAADRRAPTPTAAAEMAVPVRSELAAQLLDDARRLVGAMGRLANDRRTRLENLVRGLGDPRRLLEERSQRLDGWAERLDNAMRAGLRHRQQRLDGLRPPTPRQQLAAARRTFDGWAERLPPAMRRLTESRTTQLRGIPLSDRPVRVLLDRQAASLHRIGDLLESYSYERVLDRGFVLVKDADERPVTRASDVRAGMALRLRFGDGIASAIADGDAPRSGGEPDRVLPPARPAAKTGPSARKPSERRAGGETATGSRKSQGELF